MVLGFTKFIVSLYLAAYLIGGGTFCLCEVRSLFDSHCEHAHGHDHGDHEEHVEDCETKFEDFSHCHCDLEPFTGEQTTPLRINSLTGDSIVFEIPGTARLIREVQDYPTAWKHPPPDRRALLSLPVLQRYNV